MSTPARDASAATTVSSAVTVATIDDLLRTADRLLANELAGATAAGRHRGASLALRTALEICVDRALETAVPGLSQSSGRAKLLCLRCYTASETARRTKAVWSHLCLACHYHQYEMGPTRDQVHAWRREVTELIQELTC